MKLKQNMRKLTQLVVVLTISAGALAGSYDDFFRAVVRDDPGEIRAWIAQGFDPNARDPNGQPAIVRALLAESYGAAMSLAQSPGFDPNARNAKGETPLMMAALKNQPELCRVLIDRGAAVDHPSGWTPLHYATSGSSPEVTRMLLAQGARIDARSPNRRTPLMMAALHASEEVIGTLLATGADLSIQDQNGATAADLARAQGRDKLAQALEERARRAPTPQSR
jgi:hypothetical protein